MNNESKLKGSRERSRSTERWRYRSKIVENRVRHCCVSAAFMAVL